jgi:hypothetical protein
MKDNKIRVLNKHASGAEGLTKAHHLEISKGFYA